MFNLGNLAGTIMLGDTPLVRFKYKKDVLQYAEILSDNVSIMPPEFRGLKANERLVRCFFAERITLDTRQGLDKSLLEHGMEYYDPETIIRYQNGRCFDDDYWLKTE